MAISSAGIGSGIDVNSLVTQLVSAERAPQDARLATTKNKINVTLSALGTFKGGLSALQAAVNAIKGTDSAIGKLATSLSSEGYFSANAGSSAVPGRYEVEVLSLAKAHKLASSTFAGGASSVVGNGTVTIGVGGDSFDVTLADGANTLADLRDAINAAPNNTGVNATLLTEDGGTRLVLTSRTAGTAEALTVSTAASGGGTLFTTEDVQVATNAQIKVDGYTYTGSSNVISAALDGVTLNLTKAEVGTKITLDISNDQTAASTAIQELVRAYNAVVGVVKKQASYDSASQTGGPLMGDIAVRSAMQQIRTILGGESGSGTYTMLAQLGVKTATDGTLSVDASKLSSALSADPAAVRSLFSGTDGVADKLSTLLDGFLDSDGRIGAQTERLQARLESIDDQTEALDRRMALVEMRYRKQFTALDALLGQLQSTSSYLTQQLSNLPGSSSS